MYIDLNLIYFLVGILSCVALIYLIVTLNNFNKFVKKTNEIIKCNKDAINDLFFKLPETMSNFNDASKNMKDVTEVVTDVTADFIVAKESINSNVELVTEIVTIIKNIFLNKF